MSRKETNAQSQKPKTNRFAIASLVLGIFTLAMWLLHNLTRVRTYPFYPRPVPVGFFPLGIIGLVMGIVAISVIKKGKQRLTGSVSAVFGIIINGFLLFALVYGSWHNYTDRIARIKGRGVLNLRGLGMAMLIYANDYDDKYPTADKWCDLLIEGGYISERMFKCPGDMKGPCSYAINPNCEPNSPPDMVLLFETKGGWNQFGGAEILTTENHDGRGCNVFFNNFVIDLKFIKTKRLGELKWKVEEGESRPARPERNSVK